MCLWLELIPYAFKVSLPSFPSRLLFDVDIPCWATGDAPTVWCYWILSVQTFQSDVRWHRPFRSAVTSQHGSLDVGQISPPYQLTQILFLRSNEALCKISQAIRRSTSISFFFVILTHNETLTNSLGHNNKKGAPGCTVEMKHPECDTHVTGPASKLNNNVLAGDEVLENSLFWLDADGVCVPHWSQSPKEYDKKINILEFVYPICRVLLRFREATNTYKTVEERTIEISRRQHDTRKRRVLDCANSKLLARFTDSKSLT